MIDTHAHINSYDLNNVEDEIKRINNLKYLNRIINVGLNSETNKEVLDIANNNKKFYASLGIHPLHSGTIESIYDLSKEYDFRKVVALGETGLDYNGDIETQTKKFIETIQLANYLELPVIVHANKMNKEALEIIKKYSPKNSFVFHCFEPNLEILKEIIKLNGFISVGTPITKSNAKRSLEIIKEVDINNLLIELDYPYMIMDKDKDGINVFNRIKSIRNLSHNELENILDNNARRLFKKLY